MTDASTDDRIRELERAAQLGDRAAAARLVAERLRAGGRDPRLDPRDGDIVREAPHGSMYCGARVVLRTWPRVLREAVRALPMTPDAQDAERQERVLAHGRGVPAGFGAPLRMGTAVRRPRAGRKGWDRVEVETAPGTWAVYQVEAGVLEHRHEPAREREVEEVEWTSRSTHEPESYAPGSSRWESSRWNYGRTHVSAVHAWRDWARRYGGGHVLRVAP